MKFNIIAIHRHHPSYYRYIVKFKNMQLEVFAYMCNTENRLFMPVAIWRTRRGDVELQREINPARMPDSLDELRQLIDADAVEPARRGSYCVRYRDNGHYFNDPRDALLYLFSLLGEEYVVSHLEDACARAARRQPAALAEAQDWAQKWKIVENPGGDRP